MELGMIGLGRMGANMSERLLLGGHRVISYDRSGEAIQRVVDKGAVGAHSLADFVQQLSVPRAIWLMVPSGDPVDQTIEQLLPTLPKATSSSTAATPTTKIQSGAPTSSSRMAFTSSMPAPAAASGVCRTATA